MASILIQNIHILDPASKTDCEGSLYIEDGYIKEIGSVSKNKADQIIEGKGLYAAPGFVDGHVHFRDPGFPDKEDIETGAKASAKGGFTSVVMMANTKPVMDNVDTLKYCLEKGAKTGLHVYCASSVTKNMEGKMLTDLRLMKENGAVCFTDDGKPILDQKLVLEAMALAKECDVPISFHEEDPAYITTNGVNEGKASKALGLKGSPRDAEITMIKRDAELALQSGAKVVIQHISSKEGVDIVRQYKKKGANIYAEATPHHFSLTEDAVEIHGTYAKMNPPLREEADRKAVIAGIKDGTIQVIATDHAPHTKAEKAVAFEKAPSGIIGLETSFSLGLKHLVNTGELTLLELMDRMSYEAAKLYQLPCGVLKEGATADLVIFSTEEHWTPMEYASKAENTPFTGMELPGVIHYTICEGKIIYQK